MKNKFASPIIGSILIVPSIDEGLPLVTRARMFWTVFGPVKVADCELFKLNWLKLSKSCKSLWLASAQLSFLADFGCLPL